MSGNRPVDPGLFASDSVVVSRPRGSGFETGKSISESSDTELANAAGRTGAVDPIASLLITEEQARAQLVNGSIKMTGETSSDFAVGDRFYHKELKQEGTILRLPSTSIAIAELADGKKGKVGIKNLVKL